MLATRISFMNMVGQLCAAVGADVDMVRRGIGTDSRIGPAFLFPGCGYGGSCFPKDVKALVRTLRDSDVDASILESVEAVNQHQKEFLLKEVQQRFGSDLGGMTFGVWGLSFKPETDDMREAPSLVVVEGLLKHGAQIRAHDPEALKVAHSHFGDRIAYCENHYDAIAGADALLIITEWCRYRQPDFQRIRGQLRQPVIVDGRNLFEPSRMRELGFEYISVGRPKVGAPMTPGSEMLGL
jgi:UDPglucose 6-dehydrogenase